MIGPYNDDSIKGADVLRALGLALVVLLAAFVTQSIFGGIG